MFIFHGMMFLTGYYSFAFPFSRQIERPFLIRRLYLAPSAFIICYTTELVFSKLKLERGKALNNASFTGEFVGDVGRSLAISSSQPTQMAFHGTVDLSRLYVCLVD